MADERDIWATLGGRLLWVRETRMGVSKRHLSARLAALDDSLRPESHSDDSVSNYEGGDRMPPADYVAAVAGLAEVSPGWLLTGEGTPDDRSALPPDAPIRDRVEHAAVILMGALTRWEATSEPEGAGTAAAEVDQHGHKSGPDRRLA